MQLISWARINSNVQVDIHDTSLSPSNALALLTPYDIILDCTDNPPARYLLSDVAVFLDKPLVSGAAQKFEGQLCIYNLGDQGPCYRCLFPKAPEPEFAGSCEETGILGAVTGIIGNLQAVETIKLITGLHGEYCVICQRWCSFGFRWKTDAIVVLVSITHSVPHDQNSIQERKLYCMWGG